VTRRIWAATAQCVSLAGRDSQETYRCAPRFRHLQAGAAGYDVAPEELFATTFTFHRTDEWLAHAKAYCDAKVLRLEPFKPRGQLASNDGYLLKNFLTMGICFGH
jgi:hypothetical protein